MEAPDAALWGRDALGDAAFQRGGMPEVKASSGLGDASSAIDQALGDGLVASFPDRLSIADSVSLPRSRQRPMGERWRLCQVHDQATDHSAPSAAQ